VYPGVEFPETGEKAFQVLRACAYVLGDGHPGIAVMLSHEAPVFAQADVHEARGARKVVHDPS
jgi:hypothetical protein